jgi:hypothetical protein
VNNRKNILDELLSISPIVATIPVVNVFSVPENYFNTLSFNILAKLPATESVFETSPKQVFSVPEGYFDGLASSILNKIKAEDNNAAKSEIASISPTIATIGNKNVFTVPENYFEDNIAAIIDNLPKPAKVIEMKKRPVFFRYVAAATITGIIGLSVISVFNNKTNNNSTIVPTETKQVLAQANQIIKNNSFDKELNSLSAKDIQQYLEQDGQDVNAALVASSIDDNTLPNPEDYIIDDKTLDDYLKKANLNN